MAAGVLGVRRGTDLGRQKHTFWRKRTMNFLMKLWKEEEGQDLTEYALLLVLLALAAIGTLSSLAVAINHVFSEASSTLTT
jgi:Flp pilus assembly pilin Flp